MEHPKILLIVFTFILFYLFSCVVFAETSQKKNQSDSGLNQNTFKIEATVDIIFENGDMMFYKGMKEGLKKEKKYKMIRKYYEVEKKDEEIGEIEIVELTYLYSKGRFIKKLQEVKEWDRIELIEINEEAIKRKDKIDKKQETPILKSKKEDYEKKISELQKEQEKLNKKGTIVKDLFIKGRDKQERSDKRLPRISHSDFENKKREIHLEEFFAIESENNVFIPLFSRPIKPSSDLLKYQKKYNIGLTFKYEVKSGKDNFDNCYSLLYLKTPIKKNLYLTNYFIFRNLVDNNDSKNNIDLNETIIGGGLSYYIGRKSYLSAAISSSIYEDRDFGEQNKYSLSYSHLVLFKGGKQLNIDIFYSAFPTILKNDFEGIRFNYGLKPTNSISINFVFQYTYSFERGTLFYNLYGVGLDKNLFKNYSLSLDYKYILKTDEVYNALKKPKNTSIFNVGVTGIY